MALKFFRQGARDSWRKTVITRAVRALRLSLGYPAGAGGEAMMAFRGQLVAITSAAREDAVRRCADEVLASAEDLFTHPLVQSESAYRARLFAAIESLEQTLRALQLIE